MSDNLDLLAGLKEAESFAHSSLIPAELRPVTLDNYLDVLHSLKTISEDQAYQVVFNEASPVFRSLLTKEFHHSAFVMHMRAYPPPRPTLCSILCGALCQRRRP